MTRARDWATEGFSVITKIIAFLLYKKKATTQFYVMA